MSAAEAAQPPAEGVDDSETEAEPAVLLAALNEATTSTANAKGEKMRNKRIYRPQ